MSFQDLYLQIYSPNIEGEATSSLMAGAIQINSFEFGWSSQKPVLPPALLDELASASSSSGGGGGAPKKGAPARGGGGGGGASMKSAISKLKGISTESDPPDDRQKFQFTITKNPDKSSPTLFKAFCQSRFPAKKPVYREAVVTMRKSGLNNRGPSLYLNFRFGQVSVSGFDFKSKGSDECDETVVFQFETCKMQYTPQMYDGGRAAPNIKGWNFKDHKAM